MENLRRVQVFVASAAEVKEERKQCILLLNQLNESHKHLHIKPWEWEYAMVHGNNPEYETIQDAINPSLAESDLVIFIFYSKIGPNTLKEFEYAVAEKKRIFLYFKNGFTPDLDSMDAYRELLQFKNTLSNTILKISYNDLVEFEKELYPNLNLYLVETFPIVQSDAANNKPLSADNLALINMLREKDEEIKKLNENLHLLPNANTNEQLQKLMQETEAIRQDLLQSEEIRKQQAADKEALEKQLSLQIESSDLKAKALEEVMKGNYSEAEKHLQESAKESIAETASTFYELAKIKKLQFQYAEAYKYYELAVKINPENALYSNEAGLMANTLGHYDKMQEYIERSLAIAIKENGEEHPKIAIRYNNLGEAYSSKGAYDKAIEYYEKCLPILYKFFPPNHPYIQIAQENLAFAQQAQANQNNP